MTNTDGQPAPSGPQQSKLGRWLVIVVLCAMLVGAVVLGYLGWVSTDIEVPAAGYLALVLGVMFSLVVGIGLMTLVFYSSRKGYDEPAVLIPEPESESENGRSDPQ
ncbi:hypothetical protein EDE08_105428 [Bradyrhizobium sp. R2.2-H]|jgi:hypothetical protein|uniref:hypothetical protein n=1 Tax=unclassified Bradyrhizobium TaxID=2631580 RepID=UPI00104AEB8C|nr:MULTISPECIES: hypothetical protein [unclassified Bradyrhizobium]TCU72566.1 hypothetical protein EDE10_105428 [Bradyrhizobium sp. Y-H1]TCU74687.1 hypothetical protein EDE08_105428 [Bradyrhizobium sp. R2.2-H]